MALDGLITGASTRTIITNPNGTLELAGLSVFKPSQVADVPEEILITGELKLPFLPKGWRGSATFVRLDNSLDIYMALQESLYYSALNEVLANMTQTITEQDGTQTQIDYVGCVLTMPDAGTFSGTDVVRYMVDMKCKRRLVKGG